MRRPSREIRKPSDEGNQSQPIESPNITLGIDQIDENRLHPTPIPGLGFLEPDLELVNPIDWFLQPITGNLSELGGIDITASEDGCIVCVSVRGTVGWLTASQGNGTGFCYIKPSCRKQPPQPPPEPSYPDGFDPEDRNKPLKPPFPPTLLAPGSHVVEVKFKAGLLDWRYVCEGKQWRYIDGWGENNRKFNIVAGKEGATLSARVDNWDTTTPKMFYYQCPPKYEKVEGVPTTYKQVSLMLDEQWLYPGIIYFEYHVGYQGDDESILEWWVNNVYVDGELLENNPGEDDDDDDNNDEQPPPKPPENDKMACCRNQTNSDALLRKIAKCVGTQQLPATMPKSFNRKVSGTTRIASIPEFQQWMAIQFSDLIGEFPKKIKIKDANLLEDGEQGLEIELPNLSEAIADMYGTSVRGTAVNEVLMAFATRMAVEICSVKAATLVGQSYSKATALALGYKMEEEKELIPFGFNFTADATKLEDFLENTEKKITVWKCKEPSSAWEYLERLMYVAGLIKAKTLRKESSTIDDTINRIIDSGFLSGDKFDDFVTKLKESGFYNLDGTMRKPDVEEI
jgi:hypothetical protein